MIDSEFHGACGYRQKSVDNATELDLRTQQQISILYDNLKKLFKILIKF